MMGFYYIGPEDSEMSKDRIRCFNCKTILSGFTSRGKIDDKLSLHHIEHPNCKHIKHISILLLKAINNGRCLYKTIK